METKSKRLVPYIIVHPGGILKDELEARGISAADFSEQSGIALDELCALLAGKIDYNQKISEKLEKSLGIDASFWMALQKSYNEDLEYHAKKKAEKRYSFIKKLTKPWNKVAF